MVFLSFAWFIWVDTTSFSFGITIYSGAWYIGIFEYFPKVIVPCYAWSSLGNAEVDFFFFTWSLWDFFIWTHLFISSSVFVSMTKSSFFLGTLKFSFLLEGFWKKNTYNTSRQILKIRCFTSAYMITGFLLCKILCDTLLTGELWLCIFIWLVCLWLIQFIHIQYHFYCNSLCSF